MAVMQTHMKSGTALDFGVILEALLANPESYVNFGEYWWTLKRMLADWAEENDAGVNSVLIRGEISPPPALELDESEVYRFLDDFSCPEDFLDWISYPNPRPVWDATEGEETAIEDTEWEESFY
ncbi:MAG: hypothetical protein C4524_13480 [Candidatus Zixiibacteriota bacterium]|nr:MAG: hypothetical protein C4524_13480 [candidate division Zixibacteria bacterium]